MDRYIQASCAPFSPKKSIPEHARRTANFHPTVWGNHFLKYASDSTQSHGGTENQHEQLKKEVRKKLVSGSDEPGQQLKLIDAILRLGVSYHFESEIDVVLNNQLLKLNGSSSECNNTTNDDDNDNDDNLYMVALRFRLLRQHGHHVSCGVFNKFKDSEGKFKESLRNDVLGLLSLYDSAHMRVHKEDILDEALEFTTAHLEQVVNSLTNPVLASQVVHALNQPIRKGLTRLEARHYIPIYQKDNTYDEALLKFAKLDFNMLQKVHQRELSDLTRWWKDFNVAEKQPFARDRMVEGYFWTLGVYFEPQYSLGRRILSKVIALTTVIDDIYDVYGTIEELILFTDAIQRWDINATNQLPEYMQHTYGALLDVYSEMEEELSKNGQSYRVDYAKQAMKQLVRAYFDEAIWYDKGYVPTMEEYMKVALVSGAFIMLATTSFVCMGELVTKQAFDWVSNNPLVVKASSVVCRLTDDMVGHEFEQERGHVASAVECYMKQHGATKQEAFVEFNKRIMNAWKDMNQECLGLTTVPMAMLDQVLNLARVINLVYKDIDGYTHSKTRVKDFVTSLLIESVPM